MSGWIVADNDADLYDKMQDACIWNISRAMSKECFGIYKDELTMFRMPSIDSLHSNKSCTTVGSVLLL